MKRIFVAILFILTCLGRSYAQDARPLPDKYPTVFQLLKHRLTASDWAKMEKFDVLALPSWALHSANGSLDSLRAIRERNPDLVVLMNVSCGFSCVNWGSEERLGLDAWAESLSVNSDTWILSDTDGDRVLLQEESSCDGGRLNFSNISMARAYARYVAGFTTIPFGDLIDGFRLDEVHFTVYWLNAQNRSIFVDGVDSLDTNRDGIADNPTELEEWWSAGVDTFMTTLRRLVGDRYITVNGLPPLSIYPVINGRFHQAFPSEEGRGWEFGMSDPDYGALVAEELHSTSPGSMNVLFSDNYGEEDDFDPDRLSTKDAPFPNPGLDRYLRFTLGSALVSGSMYAMSGWGTAVDWKDRPVPAHYQTLWWFDVYDTLRTNLGRPTGRYTRYLDDRRRDCLARRYTGGMVRVYPDLKKAIFDLRPVIDSVTLPLLVRPGDDMPIRWSAFDPNGSAQSLDVAIDLSRDGGATFPERLGTAVENDTLYTWIATGAVGESCVVRITATDSSALADTAYSSPFLIAPNAAVSGGSAEIRPVDWIINLPVVACTLMVDPQLADTAVAGWKTADIVIPGEASLAAFRDVRGSGGSLPASYVLSADTLHVTLDQEFASSTPVTILFDMIPPTGIPPDSLRFEVALRSELPGDPATWLDGGDVNRFAGEGGGLAVSAGTGPAVEITVAPAETLLTAGDTLRFAVTAHDTASNGLAVTPVWSIGDTLGVIDTDGTFRAIAPGTMTVIADFGHLSDTAVVTIATGAPATLLLEPGNVAVAVGNSANFSAVVRDGRGNVLNVPPEWSATDSIGTIDDTGRFTATGRGAGVVRAGVGDLFGTSTVEVFDTLTETVVIPGEPVITADSTLRFVLEGITALGDTIEMTASWSLLGLTGQIDEAGLFTPLDAGSGIVVAETGVWAESTAVTVIAGAPATLILTGAESLAAGDTLPVGAALYDRKGNIAGGEIRFRAEGSCGGDFTPPFICTTSGNASIIAEFESLSDTLPVVVGHAEPSIIMISPPAVDLEVDSVTVFTVESFDRFGNPVPGGWSFSTFGVEGTIDSTGRFTARTAGSGGIVVSIGDAADTALVTVEANPAAAAATLRMYAPTGAYRAADWPDPWLLVIDADDSTGNRKNPDSLYVTIELADPSLAAVGFPSSLAAEGVFPESLYVPIGLLGGCGEIVLDDFTAGRRVAEPDTVPFATPDVDGNFRIDLDDPAAWLRRIEEGDVGGTCDLNGDGAMDNGDLDVVVARLEGGYARDEAAEGSPRWVHLGSSPAECPGESLSSRFLLYAEALDPIRGVYLSFDLSDTTATVEWRASGGWSSPLLREMSGAPGAAECLIVNDGVFTPDGGPIAEIVVCGATEESWAVRGAGLAPIDADFVVGRTIAIGVEFELDVEDSSGVIDTTARGDSEGIPTAFTLFPGRPNPFRDRTVIRYGLPVSASRVSYSVYTPNGRLVLERSDLPREAGFHAVEWDGRDAGGRSMSPGTYFIRFRTPTDSFTRKLTLLR